MERQIRVEKLKKFCIEELLEFDHNIEEVFLLESQVDNSIGYLIIDNTIKETCWCNDCLQDIMMFKSKNDDYEDYLASACSQEFFDKIIDKTNGGRLTVKKMFD